MTVGIADALLAARASPSASDPREPDPAWYHRQRGRHDIADLVAAMARSTAQLPSPPATASQSRPLKAFPSMSAAEMVAARQAWNTRGTEVRGAMRFDAPHTSSTSSLTGESVECAICMADILDAEDCLSLPCGGQQSRAGADSRSFRRSLTATLPASGSCGALTGRPHAFHTSCLEKWWRKSCRCPTCRRDVRPWLMGGRGTTATSAPGASSGSAISACGSGGGASPVGRMRRGPPRRLGTCV